MQSHIDAKHPRHPEYTYPPSPPSSATVTAHSSPRLNPFNDPPIVGQYAPSPVLPRANSQRTKAWTQQTSDDASDSDESVTAVIHRGLSPSSTPPPQIKPTRSLTMPSSRTSTDRTQIKTPPKTARPLFHRTSYSSFSSSSSSSDHDSSMLASTPASAGIGRKVAATLQLFKETAGSPGDDLKLREPSIPEGSVGRHKLGPSHKADDVPEPQYEFVKRSEWPDRETAAIRREKSSTGLSRARTRDGTVAHTGVDEAESGRGRERKLSVRDNVINDLTQWRKDVMHSGRGRRLERASDVTSVDPEIGPPGSAASTASASRDLRELNLPSPLTHPRSRVYPPSPSPSRSPFDRIPQPLPNIQAESAPTSSVFRTPVQVCPSRDAVSSNSRSPTPAHTLSPTYIQSAPLPVSASLLTPPDPPHSPWTTDDESGWETASATTSTSTTSAASLSPLQMNPRPYLHYQNDGDDKNHVRRSQSSQQRLDEPDANALDETGDTDLELDMSQGGLPHIPLRPFRNQVGGHSAIYKFTKRAVCKVRRIFFPFVRLGFNAF